MKKLISVAIAGLFIFPAMLSAAQKEIKLTTYYPAPYGEYKAIRSQGACVGTNCGAADVTDGNLKVKGATTSTNLTVNGTTNLNGTTTVSGAGSLVIQKRSSAPTSPVEGQIWIQ
jgi:hypothetical protein